MPRLIVTVVALLLAANGPLHAQERAALESISVHLFLEKSGTFSDDVTDMEGFAAHNFAVSGPGIAEGERFHAALIKVKLTAPHDIFAKGTQAEIVVIDRATKKVVKRQRIADVYIGANGWTIYPVFLADAACGPFDIVASAKGKRIAKALEVHCGE